MTSSFKALTISELLPRPGRRNGNTLRHVLNGDHEDIRICENLYYVDIVCNWHSQHGYIKFKNGEKFWYYNRTINGNKVFLFRVTEEYLSLLERKNYEKKISDWTNSASSKDLVALHDLVLEAAGKESRKLRFWSGLENCNRDSARKGILSNLSRLSVMEQKNLWGCLNPAGISSVSKTISGTSNEMTAHAKEDEL